MKKQAVIFIHGIGEQKAGYSHDCMDDIDKKMLRHLQDKDSSISETGVLFREVLWAHITSKPQAEVWKRVNKSFDLDMVKLRKFFVAFGGDAVAYQKDGHGDPIYTAIHDEMAACVAAIQKECDCSLKNIELTFVAHSLGTVVTSNYLYDQRKTMKATNLFTLGSPLALWSLRFGGPAVADSPVQVARPHGTWINILDDEDIIGYPLRDLNPKYREAVDMDYVTEIGGVVSWGNPISHIGYWKDSNVTAPIAFKLAMDYWRITKNETVGNEKLLKFIQSL